MGFRTTVLVLFILASALTTSLIPGFSSGLRPQTSDLRPQTKSIRNPQSAIRNPQSKELLPGAPIEQELKGGEGHSYHIALEAGQFVLVAVHQKGIHTVVTITGPDGRKIIEMSLEAVSILAETTGPYLLQVRAKDKDAPAGRYQIRLDPPRPASAQDQARASGERILSEGELLFAQAKATSIREAIEKYKAALALFREAEQPSLEAFALLRIGASYLDLPDETQRAREYFNEALALARTHGDRLREAQALGGLGRFYKAALQPQKALDYFDQAVKLHDALGDLRGKAATLVNMGHAFSDLAESPKALEAYNQALALSKAVGDRSNEARIYNSLGLVHRDLGDLPKALENYNRALPLSRATDNPELEFMVLNNTGIVYKELGDDQKALDSYEQSLKLSRNLGNVFAEAQLLNNIGNIYKIEGENQTALDYYHQALSLFRRLQRRGGEAAALNNIGSAYYQMGEYQKALDYHEQSRAIRQTLGDRRGEASALNQAGRARHKLGDLEKALASLRQSLDIRRQLNDPIGEAETLLNLAAVERDRGQWAASQTEIEAALTIIESLRAKISDAGLRASYLARMQEMYEFYVDLLMRRHQQDPSAGYDAAALQAAERARARVLLESLVEARADIRQGVDPVLLERERGLRQQLDANAERLTRLLSSKYTEEQKTTAEKEVNDLLRHYQDVQTQIRARSPRYAALTQPQPLSLKEIQQQVLDDDTILLEYTLGQERSFVWAVTPHSMKSYELPKRAQIEAAARRVYELLTARNQSKEGETDAQRRQRIAQADAQYAAAAALSQMILAPLAEQLGTNRLLIVADGALQYVPFGALPAPRPWSLVTGHLSSAHNQETRTNDQGRMTKDRVPLIVDHEIVSLPSASVLAVLRQEVAARSPAGKTVAILADPVFQPNDPRVKHRRAETAKPATSKIESSGTPLSEPDVARSATESGVRGFQRLRFSRWEADAIATLVAKEQGLKAIDFAASKSTAMSTDLTQYRILHFATHGLLNSQHPELSGVVLSLVSEQGEPQDGFLRLHEIYNLKLNADLVVLSACQTALGKDVKGEGLVGLTRGFMYAGAARVMASLWSVQDRATAELMKRFYQELVINGQRPPAALRLAQVSMWKEHRAPHYWAAFTLQGEWK
jgi:CHAT domain-containing protein